MAQLKFDECLVFSDAGSIGIRNTHYHFQKKSIKFMIGLMCAAE